MTVLQKINANLVAVEAVSQQTIAGSGSAVGEFFDVPDGFELESFVLRSSAGGGTLSGSFESTLDILDGNDAAVLSLSDAAGNLLGAGAAGGTKARYPIQTNLGSVARSFRVRVERIRGRIDIVGSACDQCRMIAYFRRRTR